MLDRVRGIFMRKPPYRPGPLPPPRLVLAQPCLLALSDCMAPDIRRHHEGIAYLLGQTNGTVTVAISAIRPQAVTTRGSFSVSAPAMAQVVRAATRIGLQLVGQVHTHPGKAFHSDGDVEGARIAYRGFVSIVLPDYGERLPELTGAAVYMFQGDTGFSDVAPEHVSIVPGRLA